MSAVVGQELIHAALMDAAAKLLLVVARRTQRRDAHTHRVAAASSYHQHVCMEMCFRIFNFK